MTTTTVAKIRTVGNNISCSDEILLKVFIPSELDDFGLDVYQFRVYCRIARRAGANGDCWESINNIAKKCNMDRKTVMQAISGLLSFGMLTKEKRPGNSDVYKLTSSRFWKHSATTTSPPDGLVVDEIPDRGKDTTSPPDGQRQSVEGTPPVRLTDTKVLQEVTPTSFSQELVGEVSPPTTAPYGAQSLAEGLEEEKEFTEREIAEGLSSIPSGICPSLAMLTQALHIDKFRPTVVYTVNHRKEFGIRIDNQQVVKT